MCTAALTVGIAAANALAKQQARHKELQSQIDANNKTAQGYIQSMNYSFQNYETQRRALFASQIEAMTKMRLQSKRQEASVKAAVNEELAGGGRTASLINRSVRADESRVASQAQANYERQNNKIDLNKETTLINTKNAINSIAPVETPSYFTSLMNLASDFFNTYNTLQNIGSMRNKAGITGSTNKGASTSTYSSPDGAYKYTVDNVRGVDLDKYIAKENMFNGTGIFAINPASSYFGTDLTSGLKYNYSENGLSRRGATWRNGLLVL